MQVEAAAPPVPLHVLLVDDDEDEYVLVRAQLDARTGYELDWAPTPAEGFERLREGKYDACLLDWYLGPTTGLEVLRDPAMRRFRGPILVLTGVGGARVDDEAMRAGAADYLDKQQVTRASLDRAIRRAIERKKAEFAVRDREQFLSIVLASIADAVIATDGEGRIVLMNRAAEKLAGISAATGAGELFHDVLPLSDELDGTSICQLVRKAQRVNEALSISAVLERGGERRILDGSVAAMRQQEPGHGGAVLVLRDVTRERTMRAERRLLEARMQSSAKLASIGTLAAGVAHEINNPLSFVYGNLELLGDTVALDPQRKRLVDDALEGVRRVRDIVGSLRTFSRSGDPTPRRPVELRDVIESALRLAGTEPRHRASIVVDLKAAPPVLADPAQLVQVVVNLLINASHAIPDTGGPHEIGLGCGTLPDGRGFIDVWDTGAGIQPDVVPHIFDPFFTTKAVGVGTGLGLPLSLGIVAAHGGELSLVHTAPGKGSRFRVALPAHVERKSPELPRAAKPATGRARVLVVDDEPLVRQLFELELAEHDVVPAGSVEEALASIAADPRFDVIFCDLMMPGRGGDELYRELQKSRPELVPRMAFVTAGAFTHGADEFLASVPNRRLTKPVAVDELRRTIAELVEKRP